MSFQFGTNWPGFMERVGNIAGPLLGYEVLTAFFLEAAFLGIMLFGHDRVGERVHLLATFLVAFGTTVSAFWILALNSWMHTPAGYRIENGEFFVDSWLADRSSTRRSPTASCTCCWRRALTVAFLLTGLAAWQLLQGPGQPCHAQGAEDRPDAGGPGDPAADLRRRPAWPEHARTPAAEDRRDGRHLAHRARRAAAALRLARRQRCSATTAEVAIPQGWRA